MSSSTADTESSMRSDKRSLTPADEPIQKRQRDSADHWDDSSSAHSGADKTSDAGIDHSKVQLPSIFTTFDDNYRNGDGRRASLPILSDRSVRHAPYPSAAQRQNYAPSNGSNLSSYTFPPPNSDDPANDRGRPRVDVSFNGSANSSGGVPGSAYDSAYPPSSGLSAGTTPSSTISSYNSEIRTPGLSPYSDEPWNASPSGIVRPSSTPGQLSSPAVKYDDALRHGSFGAPMSQAHMFAGSAPRISGQHDRRSLSGIKSEWSFPNSPDFALPQGNPHYSPQLGPGTPNISVHSPSRSPNSMPSSALADRPTRKRGKLPKETTDYLKAWLHRHSDHPYPSEEEKKQLCHATGLSMSQVSNWMINVRDLAPPYFYFFPPLTAYI